MTAPTPIAIFSNRTITRQRRTAGPTAVLITLVLALGTGVAVAGVRYTDPAGGWRYQYDGTFVPGVDGLPDGYGRADDSQSLDGTWNHDQSDKWDGTAPGDPLSDPDIDPLGTAPGGVGAFSDGSTNYIRLQDTGNPELHGWQQGPVDPQNSNRRLYFGHRLSQDGLLASEMVLDSGITVSFRARIPAQGPLDDIYSVNEFDEPVVLPWGNEPIGYPIHDDGRGMFGVVQNNPDFFDQDNQISFSLLSQRDIEAICDSTASVNSQLCTSPPRSGGLIMNNQSGTMPNKNIDVSDAGQLNILEISDSSLTAWREFWITIQRDGSQGTHTVKVYLDGSTAASEFRVTASSDGNAEYLDDAWLTMGLSSTGLFGAVDVDFLAYSLGVILPQAAVSGPECDLNGDGSVDAADAGIMFGNWGGSGVGDKNGDSIVDAADAGVMFSQWTGDRGPAHLVPESAGAVWLLGMLAYLASGRRVGRLTHRNA